MSPPKYAAFYADLPESALVYRQPPTLDANGQVVGQTAVAIKTLSTARETQWQTVNIRRADRGSLRTDFARTRSRRSKLKRQRGL